MDAKSEEEDLSYKASVAYGQSKKRGAIYLQKLGNYTKGPKKSKGMAEC